MSQAKDIEPLLGLAAVLFCIAVSAIYISIVVCVADCTANEPDVVKPEPASRALKALSEHFPDDIADRILDFSAGHRAMHTEKGYAARVLHSVCDPCATNHQGYHCSFEGSPIIKPSPPTIPRLMLEEKVLRKLSSAEMTLSFRFKASSIGSGDGLFYSFKASSIGLFSSTNSFMLSGKALHALKVVDGEWHVAVLRVSNTRTVFEFMIDSAQNVGYGNDLFVANKRELALEQLHFGGQGELHSRMDGEIADIRVYDWVLDAVQCQMLMENYTTPYCKRKDAERGNVYHEVLV